MEVDENKDEVPMAWFNLVIWQEAGWLIFEPLIQITHTTGRYSFLSGDTDRAKKNLEIMFNFEIYGIMEEGVLNFVEQECDKIQHDGYDRWSRNTMQAIKD